MIPDNACLLRLTAAAGTELAETSLLGTVSNKGYWPHHLRPQLTEVYDPKAFILHTVSLRQAFAHCAIFPTAASRRSLGRISVPVWPVTLSGRLPIIALVSHYLTNKLIGRRLILKREPKPPLLYKPCGKYKVFGISHSFEWLSPSPRQIAYALLTRSPLTL